MRVFGGFVAAALAVVLAAPVLAQGFAGTYSLKMRAAVGMSTTYQRYDLERELRTDTISVAQGADGLGSLAIRPDGTYELRYWYYETINRAPVVRGRWAPVGQGEFFADKGAIKLIDAVPNADRSAADRAWYVFREGNDLIARYSPFAETIILSSGGATARPAPTVATAAPRPAPAAPAAAPAPVARPAPAAPPARSYTPDQVREALRGKTVQEVTAILGPPAKQTGSTYAWNDVEKVFPHCAGGCNWRSFSIWFNGQGRADSIELQYWRVE